MQNARPVLEKCRKPLICRSNRSKLKTWAANQAASHTPKLTLRDWGWVQEQFLREQVGVGQDVSGSGWRQYEKQPERVEEISPYCTVLSTVVYFDVQTCETSTSVIGSDFVWTNQIWSCLVTELIKIIASM
jgi:hypothetical protein